MNIYMFLEFNSLHTPMKLVYSLKDRLNKHPDLVKDAQALTLDSSRPTIGLRGSKGLFGSDEWWLNIQNKKMPLVYYSGPIKRIYSTGQNSNNSPNTIDIDLGNNASHTTSIYLNNKKDIKLFSLWKIVAIVYVLDERKLQPANDGNVSYLDIVLEMAISI